MIKLQRLLTSRNFQRFGNKKAVSALFGWLADVHFSPRILQGLIRTFIQSFDIEADKLTEDIASYRTFNAFFRRRIKPEFLHFEGNIASFAQGVVTSRGTVADNCLLQVKGRPYRLSNLLDTNTFPPYRSYITLYLSLGDYHRVHFPFDARIRAVKWIPGTLYSLGPESLNAFGDVYCRNERIIIFGTSDSGEFALILVGALVVGRIKLTFTELKLNKNELIHTNIIINQGDEAGYFEMGSSVILLTESDALSDMDILSYQKVNIGEKLC
jgi:phosphatidylserine decarboxylase